MSADVITSDLDKYHTIGEQKFYKHLLCQAIAKIVKIRNDEYKGTSPEMEYLNFSEKFLILYRREGIMEHLEVSKIFRKAAHKIYRIMLKKKMISVNSKFLNLV